MITDTIDLSGLATYFTDPSSGSLNLASGATGVTTALSSPLKGGQQWEVSGLDFVFDTDQAAQMLKRQTDPILEIGVIRELLPGHYRDAYKTRVHAISGQEDFSGGVLENAFLSDVQGVLTLVASDQDTCRWLSKSFDLVTPSDIDAIAWHMAVSKRTHDGAFTYTARLHVVDEGGSANIIDLVVNADPADKSFADGLGLSGIVSFQFEFIAKVRASTHFSERRRGRLEDGVGLPLLHGVSVLEEIDSALRFHSLSEMLSIGAFDPPVELAASGVQTMRFSANLQAVLNTSKTLDAGAGHFERIALAVNAAAFTHFEARIIGEEMITRLQD
ncbi:hypothetical protein [Roseobacter sp. MH60115]|uniref:hypothetical protein n=1 Tax=Roseobacter sp. MH60115 TaxID=2785324 RepID=UPI0018A29C21|nr:hypothetical protein [Roseobacter sp. MH60115]